MKANRQISKDTFPNWVKVWVNAMWEVGMSTNEEPPKWVRFFGIEQDQRLVRPTVSQRKMFFIESRAWDEKNLSPHEEANLRPSDSALRALPLSHRDSTVSKFLYDVHTWQASCIPLRSENVDSVIFCKYIVNIPHGDSDFFLCLTLVTGRKTSLSISLPSFKITISLIIFAIFLSWIFQWKIEVIHPLLLISLQIYLKEPYIE